MAELSLHAFSHFVRFAEKTAGTRLLRPFALIVHVNVRFRVTLLAAGGVERNADEKEHDGKHDDTDENVHGYNLPICRQPAGRNIQ